MERVIGGAAAALVVGQYLDEKFSIRKDFEVIKRLLPLQLEYFFFNFSPSNY